MPVNRTDNANSAPRCQHIKLNGDPCRAPALRGRSFCRFHDAIEAKRHDYGLPIIEDATSLQFAVMQVIRALADKAVEPKTAALMLYGLQIAGMNLKRFANEQSPATYDEDEASLAELLLHRLGLDEEIPALHDGTAAEQDA